jgi:translation elongation factor EF-4
MDFRSTQIKGRGYALTDYEIKEYRTTDMVKVTY